MMRPPVGVAHLLALASLALVVTQCAQAAQECPRRPLKSVRPDDLGVMPFSLLGSLPNPDRGNRSEAVVLRGFLRLTRTFEGVTRAFGYAWLEDDSTDTTEYMDALIQTQYLQLPLPVIGLSYMAPDSLLWSPTSNFTLSYGTHQKDNMTLGIRMDVTVPTTTARAFKLKVYGWARSHHFGMHNFRVLPGSLTPWYNMKASEHINYMPLPGEDKDSLTGPKPEKSRPRLPPSQSPTIVVLRPLNDDIDIQTALFKAQTLLRHIEYHILQAKLQRYLIYWRPEQYTNEVLHSYISRHLPKEALPYVTFVIWDSLEFLHNYWDQHMIYYHAVTAYSGYADVMATFLDLDEYLSWPKPYVTYHEAMARCDTDNRDSIGLFPIYTLCEKCVEHYKTDRKYDKTLWRQAESAIAARLRGAEPVPGATNATNCRWYTSDPLVHYSWINDDSLYKTLRSSYKDRLKTRHWWWWGKVLTRIETTIQFNMHRAFPKAPYKFEYLDPEKCVVVTHMHSLVGYRGADGGYSDPQFYKKHWRSNWWLIPDKSS